MKKCFQGLFAVLVLLVFILPVFAFAGKEQVKSKVTLADSQLPIAADFKLNDLEGKEVVLSDYLGKNGVLLFFWTTWCPYCRAELKELQAGQEELLRNKIVLFAIDSGEQKNKVDSFIKSRNLSLRVLLDKDGQVSDRYELLGVPTYFLVNKKGKIIFSGNHFPKDKLQEIADVR